MSRIPFSHLFAEVNVSSLCSSSSLLTCSCVTWRSQTGTRRRLYLQFSLTNGIFLLPCYSSDCGSTQRTLLIRARSSFLSKHRFRNGVVRYCAWEGPRLSSCASQLCRACIPWHGAEHRCLWTRGGFFISLGSPQEYQIKFVGDLAGDFICFAIIGTFKTGLVAA